MNCLPSEEPRQHADRNRVRRGVAIWGGRGLRLTEQFPDVRPQGLGGAGALPRGTSGREGRVVQDVRATPNPVERVLFVSADVPWPPDGGGRIASLRVLEAFARLYAVDLVALADPFEPLDTAALRTLCGDVEIVPHPFTFGRHRARQLAVAARSVASLEPYRTRKFRSAALAASLARRRSSGRYDLVHHEQFGVAQYFDPVLPATVLTQNVEAGIYRGAAEVGNIVGRTWARLEAAKLGRSEAAMLSRFDHVFVLSDDDLTSLRASGIPSISTIPIPAGPVLPPHRPPAGPLLLTLGSMSWFGVSDGLGWFHDNVFPLVRERVPGVEWQIVGPGAPPRVRSWAGEPGIRLLGYVHDLADVVARSRVMLVPLRVAGGIRIKLLDAMAWGVPAVATSLGGQGIQFEDGEGCFRRDDPRSFAGAVIDLLVDDDLWERTADRGRAFLARHHRTADLDAAIREGVDRALARRASAGHGR